MIYFNGGQINQVLLNFIMNSGYAVQDQGTITIQSKKAAEWLEVSVADTGKGIPASQLDTLFAQFFTTKPVGEGSG